MGVVWALCVGGVGAHGAEPCDMGGLLAAWPLLARRIVGPCR